MTRLQILRTYLLSIFIAFWMILDLALNSIVIPFLMMFWAIYKKDVGNINSPMETMSARAGRGVLSNKPLPRKVTVPVIDAIFRLFRQKPYFDLPDGRRFEHPSHSLRAFVKTKHGAYLPKAYHDPLPAEVEACYRDQSPT